MAVSHRKVEFGTRIISEEGRRKESSRFNECIRDFNTYIFSSEPRTINTRKIKGEGNAEMKNASPNDDAPEDENWKVELIDILIWVRRSTVVVRVIMKLRGNIWD